MKKELHISIVLLISSIWLSSCAGDVPATQVSVLDSYTVSNTVSMVDILPKDGASQVGVDSEVIIKFSDQITQSGVTQSILSSNPTSSLYSTYLNFNVQNELGAFVPGQITFNAAGDEIHFRPLAVTPAGNILINLETHTTYRATAQFVRDIRGQLIAPFIWEFRTVDSAAATGKFDVSKLEPTSSIIGGSDPIVVTFTEQVTNDNIVNGVRQPCSDTFWSDAFQIIPAGVTGVPSISGRVCVLCQTNGYCNQLQFTPSDPWPQLSVLTITIKDTPNLSGISNDRLLKNHTETRYTL